MPLPGVSDLIRLLQQQTEALAALPSTLTSLNKSIRGLARTVEQARETAVTVQRLASRADSLLSELEQPLRELAPGLLRLARVLDDPALEEVPTTFRRVQEDALPLVGALRDMQNKVAAIATSTDRITSLIDQTSTRLSALPGASLLARRRPVAEPGAPASEAP